MTVSARTLISDALIELNVYRENQSLSANDASRGLRMLNRAVGVLNSRQVTIPATTIALVSLVANQVSYTVGITGDWAVAWPERILAAAVIINNQDYPLNVRDLQWWQERLNKTATATDPTDLFYNPTYPLGTAYVWPIATSTDQVRLYLGQQLSAFADLDTAYDIEPVYEQGLVKILVKEFCGPWRVAVTPMILEDYRVAMQTMVSQSPGSVPPRIRTNDMGTSRGYFDTRLRRWI